MSNIFKRAGGEIIVAVDSELGSPAFTEVSALEGGGSVVTWWRMDTNELMGQRLSTSGAKLGAPFLVAESLDGAGAQDVTALAGGGFVVAWMSNADHDLVAQMYDSAGAKIGGIVTLAGGSEGIVWAGRLEATPGGGFVAVWYDTSTAADGSGTAIKGRLFGAAGTPLGAEFLVNSASSGNQQRPDVAILASGGFVVTWWDEDADGPGASGIKAQRFGASGEKIGGEIFVTAPQSAPLNQAEVTGLLSGGFVVTWTDLSGRGTDSSGTAVRAQVFDAAGLKVGGEIQVNGNTAGGQSAPSITALASDGFAIVWKDDTGDSSGSGVKGRIYDAAGASVGDEFLVNVQGYAGQSHASIDALGSGFVVSWVDFGGTGPADPSALIRAQIFAPAAEGPNDISLTAGLVRETAIEELPVATLSASGAGVNSGLTYTLIADSTGGAFRIDGNRLVVADNRRLDFETAPVASLTFRVTDIEGRSYEETISLPVADVAAEVRLRAGGEVAVTEPHAYRGPADAVALSSGNYLVTWGELQDTFQLYGRLLGPDGQPLGDAFRINPADGRQHWSSESAALSGGGFVAAWEAQVNQAPGTSVLVQRFDASGAALGGPTEISAPSPLYRPSVTALPTGGYLVAWIEFNGSTGRAMAQVFDAGGGAQGNTFQVSAVGTWPFDVEVASLADGGWVAVWRYGGGFQLQRFDSTGARVGGTVEVFSQQFNGTYLEFTVTGLTGGGYAVAFQALVLGEPIHAFVQIYDRFGARVGDPIDLAPAPENDVQSPALAALASGGFIASWSAPGSAADKGAYDVFARPFDARGNYAGSQITVPADTAGGQRGSAVAVSASGAFLVAWRDDNGVASGDAGYGIEARAFTLADSFSEGTGAMDLIIGTSGNDAWRGLAGSDVFRLWQGGDDIAHGNGGNDVFLLGASLTAADEIDGGTGADTLAIQGNYALTLGTRNLLGIETLVLLPGSDTRFGDVGTNSYTYVLTTIDANLAAGAALLVDAAALRAGETLTFDGSAETNGAFDLRGGAGADSLTAGSGGDRLDGGAGPDTLRGGAGNDLYVLDDAGDQAIELAGGGSDEVRTALGSATDFAHMFVLPDNIEKLTGTSATGQGVFANALDNVVAMGPGNDLVVLQDGGDDTVSGGAGDDFLYFGASFTNGDSADGGAGFDTVGLLGSYIQTFAADDLLNIEKLAVYSTGVPSAPNSYALTTVDQNVAAGRQLMVVAQSLQAGESLWFNGQAEIDGSFNVRGGRGADTITGGAGNDTIWGNLGADTLKGGGGFDIFEYQAAADSTAAARDSILDFAAGDKLHLAGIDADGNAANGDSKFAWIGDAAFGHIAGQLRATAADGGWLVEGDIDGDGAADLVILVQTVAGYALGRDDIWL